MTFDDLPLARPRKWLRLTRGHGNRATALRLAKWLRKDGNKVKVTREVRWFVHCLQAN